MTAVRVIVCLLLGLVLISGCSSPDAGESAAAQAVSQTSEVSAGASSLDSAEVTAGRDANAESQNGFDAGPGPNDQQGQGPQEQPWNEGKSPEQIEAERIEAERDSKLRAQIIPTPVDLIVAPEDVYPPVGRDVDLARETTHQSASAFAEAVSLMISDGHFDADVLELPGRVEPVSYPRESSYLAAAVSRRRGVSMGSDTFYRPVSDRVWTAVFTSSARAASGKVEGFCFGVYVQASADGSVLVGVEPVPLSGMVPGTRRVPSRIACMPGSDTTADSTELE